MVKTSPYPFVQARHFTRAGRTRVDLVVLHSMESQEKPNTAENVASWFAGPSAPQASAHYCIDSNSIVGCVKETDVAWHAAGANHNGIGLEHAGYARQTEAEWLDAYGVSMLLLSAKLCAEICLRWNIPIVRVSAADLRTKTARGLCGHKDVNDAFYPAKKDAHWDPGPGFPWSWYLNQVEEAAAKIQEACPPTSPPPAHVDLTTTLGVQSALQALGYAVGPVDGVMGKKTRGAITAFQERHDLDGDGVVGPKTRAALTRALEIVRVFTSQ